MLRQAEKFLAELVLFWRQFPSHELSEEKTRNSRNETKFANKTFGISRVSGSHFKQDRLLLNYQEIIQNEKAVITHRRYRDNYFLARVWAGGNNIGRELQQSRLERQTAQGDERRLAQRGVKPEVITVTAQ